MFLSELTERLRALFRRSAEEREMRDEIGFHVEMEAERLMSEHQLLPDEAHRQAMIAFGGVERIKEDVRDERGTRLFDDLMQDIRYALRTLRKNPFFTGTVVFTLALGIGGTTAVFSVVQGVLLAPLPYEQPGQLVRMYQMYPENPSRRFKIYMAGPQFREIRDHATSFRHVAALNTYREMGLDLTWDGRAERLRVLQVTSDYFRTLGSAMHRGREFHRDDEAGTSRVVLSDDLWRTRFDGDPSIIGTTIRLSDEPAEVVGIAPPDFEDPIVGEVDLWMPFHLVGATNPDNPGLTALGRLRNGVRLEQARAELAAMSQEMAERWPGVLRNVFDASPLKADLVATAHPPLRLLLFAVGLVLVLACVNVANLALMRATDRSHEFAIRAALGSGSVRIARQLLVESILLAGFGGVLGFGLAVLGVDVLKFVGQDAIPRLDEVGFDTAVLGFAVLVTVATAVAFGVAPALRFARVDPNQALGQQSRAATAALGQGRLRSGMVAAQLALALTLLSGAGVLMASFHRLRQLDLGFRIGRVLTFDLTLPSASYDAERRVTFQRELLRGIETIPGVTAAGAISFLPATGNFHPWATRISTGPLAGTWLSTGRGAPNLQQRFVNGDFFTALRIPVLAGRTFAARDYAGDPARVVVSAGFAERAFPGIPLEDVIGQRIRVAVWSGDRDIIGIVGDLPLDAHGSPGLIVLHPNGNLANGNLGNRGTLTYVVAAELPPDRILPVVREVVAALDADLVVYNAAPMSDVVGRGVSRERFALVLIGAFAAVASTLAALGLYGVLAYTVRLRTQEIGIRIALGATAAHVRGMVLRQAGKVVAIGLVTGIAGALVLGRWLSSLVFEISPWDPRILVATTVLLAIIALLSASLPAWRASRVEPRIALQEE